MACLDSLSGFEFSGMVSPGEREPLLKLTNFVNCGDIPSLFTIKTPFALVSSCQYFRQMEERSRSLFLDQYFNWLLSPDPLRSFVSITVLSTLSPAVSISNAVSSVHSVCLVFHSSFLFFGESCFGQIIFDEGFLDVSKRKAKAVVFNLDYDIGEGLLAMSTYKTAVFQVWSNSCEGFLACSRTKAVDLQLISTISSVQDFSAYVINNFLCFMMKLAMFSSLYTRHFALFSCVQERIFPPHWFILYGRLCPCEIPGTHTITFIASLACGFNRPEVTFGSVSVMILGDKDWSSTSRYRVTRLLRSGSTAMLSSMHSNYGLNLLSCSSETLSFCFSLCFSLLCICLRGCLIPSMYFEV